MDRYATLRNGLIAAYCPSLGATGNRLVDRVGRADGTLISMGGQYNWMPVNNQLALSFDGVDDRVEMTLPSVTTSRFSIHGWGMYRSLTTPYAALVFFRQPAGNIGISNGASSALVSQWNDTAAEYNAATGLSLTANRWFRFAMVVNGSTITTWLDASSFTVTITATSRNVGGVWSLGRDPFTSARNANCIIDDVRFYSRALTQAEMSLLYTAGRGAGLLPTRHRRFAAIGSTKQMSVRVGGSWVNATPYVKVSGVWQQATPYTRVGGVWK